MDLARFKIHNIELEELLKIIDSCKGNVYLETEDGDILNLKSKLCQLIGIAEILKSTNIAEAVIRCENKDDESALFRFNLYHSGN